MLDQIEELKCKGLEVALITVDIQGAFNSADPDVIYKKAIKLGLPNLVASWIRDFILNRTIYLRRGKDKGTLFKLLIGIL
jgi:hypothetical protein